VHLYYALSNLLIYSYKVFSIRIKETTVKKLDAISKETNRSRNDLINLFIDYAIENCEIK